ncbi:hypothetical protein CONLIGDRAFT_39764 [Coniochaeta ligniaria NRRL 30616]|uniref:Uncharacterized protein n=1 Tax=Coniochaeta ligniaria NRRL 30616 TaxID=1408157 RepID=A0A1J7J6E4_9PEZI|nr:hypothetical protein CONLIGDRAFT_39764 [Coniochaeta ligniaria NRRL 30616]
MYKDMALLGGGASSYSAGPPVALYDLILQKESPMSYAYSCDMSIVGEEEREDDTVPSYHSAASPPPPIGAPDSDEEDNAHGPGTQDETPDRSAGYTYEAEGDCQPGQLSRPQTPGRPQITQRETYPQTAKRPNWQTIRYQTMPGRAHRVQLEAWVSGWSAAVGELGDETYCACADSTAAAAPDDCSPPPPGGGRRRNSDRGAGADAETGRGRRREEDATTTTPTSSRPDLVASVVCHNCSRQPSPSVAPDQDFVFPPSTGAGKMALKCRLVWQKIVGRTVGRQGSDKQGRTTGRDNFGAANAYTSQTVGHGGYDKEDYYEDDDEDDEVDVDKLSRSSKEGHVRRVRDDIAERQARLRRAQRLLRKESSRNMRQAG